MLRRRITVDAVSAFAAIVLGLAWVVIAQAIRRQGDAWEWVVHTRDVLERLEQVNALTRTAESEQRGYLLTSDPAYLALSDAAAAQAGNTIAAVATLTADNPIQQASVRALQESAQQRLQWLHRTIDASAPARPDADGIARGHALMLAIAERVATMENEEQRLLAERERSVASARRDLIVWVSASGAATLLLIAVLRAVSRRANAEIRLAQAKVNAIYHSAPVGLAYVDRDMRLVELNEALAAMNGRPRAEQLDKRPEQLLPAALAQRVQELYERVLTTGRAQLRVDVHAPSYGTAGAAHDWIASYQPVVERERVVGIVVSVLDVSPLKDAQRALTEANRTLERRVEERTRQLSDANEDLEAFAHTVAHDLRAPLRNIEGFASALLEDERPNLTRDGQTYLQRMQAGVRRMDQLISDLLAYSRLGRAELALETVSLAAAVKSAIGDLSAVVAQTRATVRVREPLPDVWANSQLVAQIVVNLLSNAIKFVATGVDPEILVAASVRPPWVDLCIEDNGIGIPAEHRERVLRVFERLHGQEAYPGTGIGLAIVNRAATKMHGRVRIEDKPGGGTRFVVSLPARSEDAAHA